MHIFKVIQKNIKDIIKNLFPDVGDISFSVESSKNPEHGDIATNVAMVLVKYLKKNPIEIAKDIAAKLQNKLSEKIHSVDVVAPGFINIKLQHNILQEFIKNFNENGLDENDINIGNGEKINIEFVSTNPTGPMHIGHSRGAVYGDALCRLLKKCGYNVTGEFYINDGGGQIATLVKSLYIRYQQLFGEDIQIPEGCYPGDYLIEIAENLKEKYGDSLYKMDEIERNNLLGDFAIGKIMKNIKEDLQLLGVQHDVFTSEKAIVQSGAVEKAIDILQSKGLIYHGVLEKPQSQSVEDWEPREQLLFKSTEFGDDSDRAILKSDGSYAYFAPDIALHLDKINRGYNKMLLLLGADHSGYTKRISAAVNALSDGNAKIDVIINQLVNLYKDGQPMKMSKRAGTFVTVRDLLSELDKDVVRFIILMYKNDTVIDLDCDKAKEQSKDNPVFYVQYAHMRATSIIKIATQKGIINENEISITEDGYKYNSTKNIDYSKLTTDWDFSLIKKLMQFPRIIELAAIHREPHRIPYYLYELATQFHAMWHTGNGDDDVRFINENNIEMSRARVALAYSIAKIIGCGLDIIGVKPLLRM